MLAILQRIIQEVSQAGDIEQALSIIVQRVKEAMRVDVCSAYLANQQQQRHILMATDGLNPRAVGQAGLAFGEGLVSLVAERAEQVNLDNAPDHPRFHFLSDTDEQAFHAFLGVPIIHHRKVLGVLVIQSKDIQKFSDDD